MNSYAKKWVKKLKKIYHNKKLMRNIGLCAASFFIFCSGLVVLALFSMKIPDFQSFDARKVVNSTQIYDRTGQVLLYDIHQDIKRTYIPFDQMSLNIKNATVAIEDAEFYNHSGIRITSIIRAIIYNIISDRTQGGSTITQQLIKNTLLTQKVTISRKVKEWVLAIKIDKALPKEKILEYYLNEVPYGGSLYGIEAASQAYFNKRALDLTLAESAYLAAIPQAPTILSPYGKHKERLESRKNHVLSRMLELGFISQEEYDRARSEVVAFQPKSATGIKAPHFVFFIKDYLEDKYGPQAIEYGGLKVISTIDADLQAKAEQHVKEGALQNAKDWNGKNAALVALDPKTGQIIAMVGSRDYFDKEIEGNYNVATARRQPGSAFKPFIYATAFNKGFTPDTVLFDLATEFSTTCDPYGKPLSGNSPDSCYMPKNHDGKFRGPMRLREALGQSINVPAVKLFYLAGLKDSLKTAEEMGITTLTNVERYGLTLVIGGGEVSLLELTSAYGVFANNGVRVPHTGVLRLEDLKGNVLEESRGEGREVFPKNTALMITDILSDNAARIPTFGANSPLNIPDKDVAAKTGTTNDNKDAWTIGYSPNLVVGVWAGNNNNAPMKKGGVSLAGPIWNKFMTDALSVLPAESFEEPDLNYDPSLKPVLRGVWQGGDSSVIDISTGEPATEFTPPEWRLERVSTNVHSILHWIDRNDITGPPPANPRSDPQYHLWETAVQNWWGKGGRSFSWNVPGQGENSSTTGSGPKLSISQPNSGAAYPQDQNISFQFTNTTPTPIQKMEIFINGALVQTLEQPFIFSFVPMELGNLREVNEFRVVSYDNASNRGVSVTTFTVK